LLLVCPKCHRPSTGANRTCPEDGARLVARSRGEDPSIPPDPLIGQTVADRYKIEKRLGEGGMGFVYAAHQSAIEKKVAIKVLKTEFSSRPEVVARFQQEAVSACRIKHPNVVDVFDVGRLEDGRFFLVMELLEGRDLSELIAEEAPLPPVRGIALALQICRALNAAHKSGVIHRDLKPENIFLHRTSDGDEIVKIVDFGIAQLRVPENAPTEERQRKLTTEGTIVGTPEYMAPEQARGEAMDHRVDIYAVGIILYEMFTGHPPFTGTAMLQILLQQMSEQPPPMAKVNPSLAIAPELEQVIMRALAKRPEERFTSMSDFAAAIARAPTALSQYPTPLTKVRPKQPSQPELPTSPAAPPSSARTGPPSSARDRIRTAEAAVVHPARRQEGAGSPWVTALAVLTVVLFFALAWALFRNNGAGTASLAAAPASPAVTSSSVTTTFPPSGKPPEEKTGDDLTAASLAARSEVHEPPPAATSAVPPSVLPAPVPSAEPAAATAKGADADPRRKGKRPASTPVRHPAPSHETPSALPAIEKCFETIGDQRREVPCP
jgi:serine/threonine-protein kinase